MKLTDEIRLSEVTENIFIPLTKPARNSICTSLFV